MVLKALKAEKVCIYLAVILVTSLMSFPVFWMFLNAFKSEETIFKPLDFSSLTFKFIITALTDRMFLIQLRNSIIISLGTVILTLISSLTLGYVLARLRFKGKTLISRLAIFTYLIPASFLVVPIFVLAIKYGVYNSFLAVIFVDSAFASPYCILVTREYVRSVPVEIEEAAQIDGASRFIIFFKILLPLIAPLIAAISMFAFIYSWNEYLYVIALLSTEEQFTAPVGIAGLLGSDIIPWGKLFAMSTIFSLPVMIFYLFVEKYVVTGLTLGAVKR